MTYQYHPLRVKRRFHDSDESSTRRNSVVREVHKRLQSFNNAAALVVGSIARQSHKCVYLSCRRPTSEEVILSVPRIDNDCCRLRNLRSVSTTRVHGPSSRAELTARELGCIFWHPSTRTPVYTARVHGRPVSTTLVHGPSWRVSKNAPEFSDRQLGPWTRAVNSGSGNRPLLCERVIVCLRAGSQTVINGFEPNLLEW